MQQLQQDKHILREGLKEAIEAIGWLHERPSMLEAQQEHIKTLERQQAKDSHTSNVPPSSDRFVRPPKSLRQVESPDEVPVICCEHCQQGLRAQARTAASDGFASQTPLGD